MLVRLQNLLKIPRRNVSALYVTTHQLKEHSFILVPHLDFEQKFSNRKLLEKNITRRRLAYNLSEIYQNYEIYKPIAQQLTTLETRSLVVAEELLKLCEESEKSGTDNKQAIDKCRNECAILEEDIKELKQQNYKLEDIFVHQYLSLPNELHGKTPDQSEVIFSHGNISQKQCEDHLSCGNLVDYYNETAYYLKGQAAIFDLHFPFYCIDQLREQGFVQFSNPDFARSIVLQSAGLPQSGFYEIKHESNEKGINLVHLVGNGSMLSFLGFIAKVSAPISQFPFKLVCSGKQYVPVEDNDKGLLKASQSTAVQVFCASNESEIEQLFDDVLNLIKKLYTPLGLHYRIVHVPSHELTLAESRRLRVEMFSTFHNEYIEVGDVCCYSDFISQRLLCKIRQSKEDKVGHFAHFLSGTICNVSRLIALLLEEHGEDFKIPSYLEDYINQ